MAGVTGLSFRRAVRAAHRATRAQIERRYARPLGDRMFPQRDFALFHIRASAVCCCRLAASRGDAAFVDGAGDDRRGAGEGRRGVAAVFARDCRSRSSSRVRCAPLARRRAMLRSRHGDLGSLFASFPARTAAVGERRLKVGLLTGCVQRLAFPRSSPRQSACSRPKGVTWSRPPSKGVAEPWRGTRAGSMRPALARRTIEVSSARGSNASWSMRPAADGR